MEKLQPNIHNIVLILNLDETRRKNQMYGGIAFYCFSIYSFAWLGKMCCKMHAIWPTSPSVFRICSVHAAACVHMWRIGRPEWRIFQSLLFESKAQNDSHMHTAVRCNVGSESMQKERTNEGM